MEVRLHIERKAMILELVESLWNSRTWFLLKFRLKPLSKLYRWTKLYTHLCCIPNIIFNLGALVWFQTKKISQSLWQSFQKVYGWNDCGHRWSKLKLCVAKSNYSDFSNFKSCDLRSCGWNDILLWLFSELGSNKTLLKLCSVSQGVRPTRKFSFTVHDYWWSLSLQRKSCLLRNLITPSLQKQSKPQLKG